MADPYDVLNIHPFASPDEVKTAYHTLSRLYHPDKASSESAGNFLALNNAYKILSDPTLRAFYDKYGHAGVSLAQEVDLSLVPTDRRFEELERKVRSLVRTSDEMKLSRFARVSAETQFGAKLLRVHPVYLRSAFTSLQQSITFDAGETAISLATTCHIQRSGGGVARLSVLVSRVLNPLTSLRLAAHLTGGRPAAFVQVDRQLDAFNSVSNTVTLDERKFLSTSLAWTHKLNAWLHGTLSLALGREPGVSVALSHKKLKSKVKLEISNSDASVSLKAKYAMNEDLVYAVGPSMSLSQGPSLELIATQNVEPFVEAMEGAFPTALVWKLNFPFPLTSLTISAKVTRGGIGFGFPLEVIVPEHARVEFALGALVIWSALPFAGLGIKTLWRQVVSKSSEGPITKDTENIDEMNESVRKFSEERRLAEQTNRGLVIELARFEPNGPDLTCFFMSRVTDSKLVLSATPKRRLFGEAVQGKKLRIRYSYGGTSYERVFGESDAVMLP
jgi:hypothetical protein